LISDAVKIIEKFTPIAVMINCIHPVRIEPVIKMLKSLTNITLGVYANIGEIDQSGGSTFRKSVTPDKYYEFALLWKDLGVKIIGGCCGTGPDYIKKISHLKKKK
jgi:5-methyltetrahydrofolate--homocysteine methyltransferase